MFLKSVTETFLLNILLIAVGFYLVVVCKYVGNTIQ